MYDGSQSTVERALEIARSGSVSSLGELRKMLSAEQHVAVDSTLSGRSIQAQLKLAIAEARKERDV